MKTGVIVYLLDDHLPPEREPEVAAAFKKIHRADRVEIVSHGQVHFDIMDAWWRLTAKGMQKFVCVYAKTAAGEPPPGRTRLPGSSG